VGEGSGEDTLNNQLYYRKLFKFKYPLNIKMDSNSKQIIIQKLKTISRQQAIQDYLKLQKFNLDKLTNETRIGNKFVDYFTFPQRLETIGIKQMSYFDFIENTEYHEKRYIKQLLHYQIGTDKHVALYRIFKLHCGSIGLFGAVKAMEILNRFKPTSVLEFCSGWGSTLTACSALGIPSYIGIDTNKNLEQPYKEMTDLLVGELHSTTKFQLYFEDAVTFDYSNKHYDCVFSSPPFYNKEIYSYTDKKTEQEWNETFYRPLFTETYKFLKVGGHYILHIPVKVYESVCIPLLGEASIIIPMKKKVHPKNKLTKRVSIDNIYVWVKH
jgi:hypothetical protein